MAETVEGRGQGISASVGACVTEVQGSKWGGGGGSSHTWSSSSEGGGQRGARAHKGWGGWGREKGNEGRDRPNGRCYTRNG